MPQKKNQLQPLNKNGDAGKRAAQQVEPDLRPAEHVSTMRAIQRAVSTPGSLDAADVAQLQRSIGNQALGQMGPGHRNHGRSEDRDTASRTLQRILDHGRQLATPTANNRPVKIQAKLTLGPVGDKYEQEADRVARQVVGRLGSQQSMQRQAEEEEELAQMKPVSSLQRQEEEEEGLAQMKPVSSLQRQEEEEELQTKPVPLLQRQEEEEEVQMKPAGLAGGGAVSSSLESDIQRAKRGGQSLSDPIRGPMERAFGADFSGVKIHTGSQADGLNQSIQARAFTSGQDIFFRQGQYSPGNSAGQELLAHELTHVLQQGGAQARRRAGIQRKTKSSIIQRFSIKKWFKKKTGKGTKEESSTAKSEPKSKPESKPESEEEQPPVDLNLNDAVEYERSLGNFAFGHPKANTAAAAMVSKMTNAMITDFDEQDAEHRKELVALYGREKVDSAGQVGTEFSSVWGAVSSGNLRERLTALYNAMFGPFKQYLTQAMKDKSWTEMEAKGLNVTKLKRRKRQMRFNIGAKDLYRDPGNPLDRKRFSSWKNVGKTRFKRDETSERTVSQLEQSKIGLSEREKAFQFGQELSQGEDISGKQLKWKEGGSYWAVNKKNKWVKKVENSMHMPVVAGPSGSMLRMFQLWEFLNKPADAASWRLAVLGWMLSSNDHSFHEMMMTAADYGLPYTPGQLAYMKVNPLTLWELRDNVAKGGLFPHELAFKRKTEAGGFHMLSQEDLEDAQNTIEGLDEDEKGAVSAPAAAMIRLYSEFGYLLLNPTKEGGLLLKKKIENAIKNKEELEDIKDDLEAGKFTVDDLIRETREMMPMMESALEMLPDWSGNLFRGTGTFSPWSYRTNSTFSFGKFGSSTLDDDVAKDFADNYNRGPFKYILKMKVTAGKDIRNLASYAEDEILLPPGSKFAVKGKQKVGKYTYVEMDQVGRGGDKLDLGEHEEIEEDTPPSGPSLTYYSTKGTGDPYDTFFDEIDRYYINPDHEEDEWTEFLYMKEGTYYWAKTAELNAFLNPPQTSAPEPETKASSSGQLLTPNPDQPIAFMDAYGNDIYESIDKPTQIEVLDDAYPDGLQGWENVEVKNLESGQVGYINYTDLKKYLGSGQVSTETTETTGTGTEDTGPALPLSEQNIQVLESGADLEMLVSMGLLADTVLKSLDSEQIAKLAEIMGTTVEDVEDQIAAL